MINENQLNLFENFYEDEEDQDLIRKKNLDDPQLGKKRNRQSTQKYEINKNKRIK